MVRYVGTSSSFEIVIYLVNWQLKDTQKVKKLYVRASVLHGPLRVPQLARLFCVEKMGSFFQNGFWKYIFP